MGRDNLDQNLPTGKGLPEPSPLDIDVLWKLQDEYLADFYKSPHFEAWLERTNEEVRNMVPFVLTD